jgi:hypothetical protein
MDATHIPHVRSTANRIVASALLCVLGLIVYGIGLAVYRLWFHELAKYPGPLLNRISDVRLGTQPLHIPD